MKFEWRPVHAAPRKHLTWPQSGDMFLLMGTAELLEQIRGLSRAEQLDLASEVWDELVRSDSVPMPDWHAAEVQRRLTKDDSNPETDRSWEAVRGRILNR